MNKDVWLHERDPLCHFGKVMAFAGIPTNLPTLHSVRGPHHSISKGVTPVLSSEGTTAMLNSMNISTVVGLRDRATIAVMTYTFARVGAVVALNVEDHYSQKKR